MNLFLRRIIHGGVALSMVASYAPRAVSRNPSPTASFSLTTQAVSVPLTFTTNGFSGISPRVKQVLGIAALLITTPFAGYAVFKVIQAVDGRNWWIVLSVLVPVAMNVIGASRLSGVDLWVSSMSRVCDALRQNDVQLASDLSQVFHQAQGILEQRYLQAAFGDRPFWQKKLTHIQATSELLDRLTNCSGNIFVEHEGQGQDFHTYWVAFKGSAWIVRAQLIFRLRPDAPMLRINMQWVDQMGNAHYFDDHMRIGCDPGDRPINAVPHLDIGPDGFVAKPYAHHLYLFGPSSRRIAEQKSDMLAALIRFKEVFCDPLPQGRYTDFMRRRTPPAPVPAPPPPTVVSPVVPAPPPVEYAPFSEADLLNLRPHILRAGNVKSSSISPNVFSGLMPLINEVGAGAERYQSWFKDVAKLTVNQKQASAMLEVVNRSRKESRPAPAALPLPAPVSPGSLRFIFSSLWNIRQWRDVIRRLDLENEDKSNRLVVLVLAGYAEEIVLETRKQFIATVQEVFANPSRKSYMQRKYEDAVEKLDISLRPSTLHEPTERSEMVPSLVRQVQNANVPYMAIVPSFDAWCLITEGKLILEIAQQAFENHELGKFYRLFQHAVTLSQAGEALFRKEVVRKLEKEVQKGKQVTVQLSLANEAIRDMTREKDSALVEREEGMIEEKGYWRNFWSPSTEGESEENYQERQLRATLGKYFHDDFGQMNPFDAGRRGKAVLDSWTRQDIEAFSSRLPGIRDAQAVTLMYRQTLEILLRAALTDPQSALARHLSETIAGRLSSQSIQDFFEFIMNFDLESSTPLSMQTLGWLLHQQAAADAEWMTAEEQLHFQPFPESSSHVENRDLLSRA